MVSIKKNYMLNRLQLGTILFPYQTFLNFILCNFMPPKHKKNSPQKFIIIPLDHEFLVRQVFALRNWDSFIQTSHFDQSVRMFIFIMW